MTHRPDTALAVDSAPFCELKLARLFSDGMVLQRDEKVAVWGWADPGGLVRVSFAGQVKTTQVGEDGKFMLRLTEMEASAEGRSMEVVSGAKTVEVKNVLVGEVWLCSGQSNMQWPVESANDFEREKAAANYPRIRMFLTDLTASTQPQEDCTGSWQVCSPQTVGEFSATAYSFGRELFKELDLPIGLIRSSWGGTPIEAWSPLASLEKYPRVMAAKEQLDFQARNFDAEVEGQRFTDALAAWESRARRARAAGETAPPEPEAPVHPHQSQGYPGSLYNAMIHPLVPYALRGAIWYQGETNAHSIEDAVLYRDLLANMVSEWRSDWSARFPFYAVQLVNYYAPQIEPVEDTGWAWIRESFLKFQSDVPNTGIAVGIDIGDAEDIHPKNKQAIGRRLAQQALAKTYGQDRVPGGPLYASMERDGDTIVLKFDDIGSGLTAREDRPLERFAIAGADRQFFAAQAVIVGKTLVVSAPSVSDPVAVRYAWANNPLGCNLANKEGFPASPFRTDDWPPRPSL